MCGLVGVANSRRPFDAAVVARMRDTMIHRGPDDEGLWSSSEGAVVLGHRRLSIIDLSARGHQPMLAADGSACIIFNGEIYNFLELRAELERQGATFVSDSDTEVILAAYRRWGDDCVAHLNGMFVFAIYDVTRGRLLIARDRAGEKPLFYHRAPGALIFASEVKALLAHGDVPRRARLDAVNQFFAYGYVPRGEAMLESIHKLPQGHALSYDVRADQLAAWPYWTLPDPPAARRRWRSEGDFCEELHTLLKDSVRRQLVADVPVGILLSGGIDSSLVTAVASEVSSSRVKTFTISFPGHGEFDEAAHARLVADHFGTEHHEMVAEPTSVDLLPRLAEQFDEPLGDSSMVPTYLVSKMIRREAKVALGGDGGDELFGGYAHHLTLSQEDRVRRFVPAPMRNAIGGAASRLPAGMRGRQRILRFAADLSRNLVRVNQFFDAEQRANLLKPLWQSLDGRGGDPETFRAALSSRSHSALQRATRVDFLTYLCDDILAKVDRASMLTSLEVRAPLLDHRIIEFAFGRIPDSLRAANRERKILLRALGRKLLPPALDLNRKQGFTVPFDDWFRGEWGGFIEEVLLQADPAIFDRDVIARLIREQRDRLSHRQRLFALTMFELWRRRYGISVTA